MNRDKLEALLAERLMKWTVCPDRFLVGKRAWMPRWRFQPIEKLADAIRLLEEVRPQEYTIRGDDKGNICAKVRIAGKQGEATGTSLPLVITYAVARAVGIEVQQ
ncbi:MAG: hypothetical protein U0R19_37665 [Bryobacteraceae bacterium]